MSDTSRTVAGEIRVYELSLSLQIEAASPEDATREAESIIAEPGDSGFIWRVTDPKTGEFIADVDGMTVWS